jgi:hypothetical protein
MVVEIAACCVLELVRKQFAAVVALELIAGTESFVNCLLVVDSIAELESQKWTPATLNLVSSSQIVAVPAVPEHRRSKFQILSFEGWPRGAVVSGSWLLGSKAGKWRFEGLSGNLASAVPVPTLVRKSSNRGAASLDRPVVAAALAGHYSAQATPFAMAFL